MGAVVYYFSSSVSFCNIDSDKADIIVYFPYIGLPIHSFKYCGVSGIKHKSYLSRKGSEELWTFVVDLNSMIINCTELWIGGGWFLLFLILYVLSYAIFATKKIGLNV